MKLCYIDTETTGTDHKVHGLIQIAGIIEINDRVIGEFDYNCKPREHHVIDDEALKVSNKTREDLALMPNPQDTYNELVKVLGRFVNKYDKKDKFFFIGYNGYFDADFVRAFFTQAGDKYFGSFFWYPIIDVAIIAGAKLMDKRTELPDFKLATVAKYLGIEQEGNLHNALTDIKLARAIYKKILTLP